jgi:hypothetical protein
MREVSTDGEIVEGAGRFGDGPGSKTEGQMYRQRDVACQEEWQCLHVIVGRLGFARGYTRCR